jgi:predicted Ser/Thr protein kinase
VQAVSQPSMLGEFRVGAVLGQGGSGIVYDATWGPRRVALKVLHAELVATGRERTQFLAEAQRLQQIAHPAVVKVLAAGELPDGRPYLAMERLEGETLASVLARGALPLERALPLFGELCAAVAALHGQALVHRDLKPENVFVVDGRHAVLLDFGIAKDLTAPTSTTTQEGNVRGTPAYMAPERFFGQPAGIATDVYELALVLCAMLAGRLPWDDAADPEARLAPRPLRESAPIAAAAVPDVLDVEIRRALSTRAQNRPASASALLEAVLAAARGSVPDLEPGETARLRPGARDAAPDDHARPGATNPGPGPDPAVVARPAPAGQDTPLAWAPTVAATTQRQPRRRVPLVVAGVVAFAAAAVAVWWTQRDRQAATPAIALAPADAASDEAVAHDPWRDPPAEPEPVITLPLVDAPRSVEAYRAEAARGVQRLPGDTHLVIALQLGELRANDHTARLLERLVDHPRFALLTSAIPPCLRAVARDSVWLVFGAPGFDHSQGGTLIARGRWQRADVETCLGDDPSPHVAADGARLYRIGELGWLDFLDDHTVLLGMGTQRDAEAVHRLARRSAGPGAAVKRRLAAMPEARTFAIVADGKTSDDWGAIAIPRGSDVFGWVLVEDSSATVDLAADVRDVAAAKAAVATVKPQLEAVFATSDASALGKLEVVRERTVVRIRGNVTALLLGMASAAIP